MNRDDVIKMLDNAKTGDIMVVSWIADYKLNEVMFEYDGHYEVVGLNFRIYRSWVKTTTGDIRSKDGDPSRDYVDLNEDNNLRFPTAEEKMTFVKAIREMEKKDVLVTAAVLRLDSKQVDVVQMRLSTDEQNPSEIGKRINDMYDKETVAWISNVCNPEEEIIFNFINEGDRVSFTLKK